jgi:hypothetical protein
MSEVVVVRPDWGDMACRWGSAQLNLKTETYAAGEGWIVNDLYAEEATKDKIIAALLVANYGSLLGHGNDTIYTAQRETTVFEVGDAATLDFCKKASNIGLNFLSCLVGNNLLPWMVMHGLKFAKGYDQEFVFSVDRSHFPNSIADPYFLCYSEFDRVYFLTQNEGQAYEAELKKWEEVIDASAPDDKAYKVHDYNACHLYTPSPNPPPPTPPPPAHPFNLTITYSGNGHGVTDPPTGNYGYDQFTQISVMAKPEDDSEFVNWMLDEVLYTENPLVFTVDKQNEVLDAMFKLKQTPQPICPVSRWIANNLGYSALQHLRAIRKSLFGVEPAYP